LDEVITPGGAVREDLVDDILSQYQPSLQPRGHRTNYMDGVLKFNQTPVELPTYELYKPATEYSKAGVNVVEWNFNTPEPAPVQPKPTPAAVPSASPPTSTTKTAATNIDPATLPEGHEVVTRKVKNAGPPKKVVSLKAADVQLQYAREKKKIVIKRVHIMLNAALVIS